MFSWNHLLFSLRHFHPTSVSQKSDSFWLFHSFWSISEHFHPISWLKNPNFFVKPSAFQVDAFSSIHILLVKYCCLPVKITIGFVSMFVWCHLCLENSLERWLWERKLHFRRFVMIFDATSHKSKQSHATNPEIFFSLQKRHLLPSIEWNLVKAKKGLLQKTSEDSHY